MGAGGCLAGTCAAVSVVLGTYRLNTALDQRKHAMQQVSMSLPISREGGAAQVSSWGSRCRLIVNSGNTCDLG